MRRSLLAVLAASMFVAGCASSKHQGAPATPSTTNPGITVPSTTITTLSSSSTAAPASSALQATQNLVATPTLKAELLAVYAHAQGYPASDFRGPVAGSVYYAYLASTNTYWALASFELASGDPFPLSDGVAMQDGGNSGIYTMPPGGQWQM